MLFRCSIIALPPQKTNMNINDPSFLCFLTVQHDFQVVEIKMVASLSTLTTFMPQTPNYGVFMKLDLFRDNTYKNLLLVIRMNGSFIT